MSGESLRSAVIDALTLMEETLVMQNGRSVTERLVEIWTLVLEQQGIHPEEVRPAACHFIATAKWFPTPAEFLAHLRPAEDRDAAAELAWQRTLTAIRRHGRYASLEAADLDGDGAALWAIERCGWHRLCTEMHEDNRAIFRAEYVRVYRLGAQEGAALSYLPGQWERENLAAGRDPTPALVGRPDWDALPASRLGAGQPALPATVETVGRELPDDGIPPRLREWAARP